MQKKPIHRISGLVVLGLTALATGCVKQTTPADDAKVDINNATGVFSPGLPGRATINPDEVVLTVNELPVTRRDIGKEFGMIAMQLRLPQEALQQQREQILKRAEDNVINRLLLLSAASDEKINVTAEELENRIQDFRSNLREGSTLESELDANKISMADFTKNLRDDVLVKKVLEEHTREAATPTDEEIAKFYEEKKAEFVQPEQMEAILLLRRFSPGMKEEERKEIVDEVEAIRKKVMDGNADFEEMAKIHSEQKSPNGEVVITVPRGKMQKQLEDFIFALKPGEISEAAVTEAGVHLIKALQKIESKQVTFDEAKDQIKLGLTNARKQEKLGAYLKQLRETARISKKQ